MQCPLQSFWGTSQIIHLLSLSYTKCNQFPLALSYLKFLTIQPQHFSQFLLSSRADQSLILQPEVSLKHKTNLDHFHHKSLKCVPQSSRSLVEFCWTPPGLLPILCVIPLTPSTWPHAPDPVRYFQLPSQGYRLFMPPGFCSPGKHLSISKGSWQEPFWGISLAPPTTPQQLAHNNFYFETVNRLLENCKEDRNSLSKIKSKLISKESAVR